MSHIYNVKPSGFNQTPILAIEEDFNERVGFEWINQNWTLSTWFSTIYVIFVFGGRYYMDTRLPFELRSILALWSACNAAFSILGTARIILRNSTLWLGVFNLQSVLLLGTNQGLGISLHHI